MPFPPLPISLLQPNNPNRADQLNTSNTITRLSSFPLPHFKPSSSVFSHRRLAQESRIPGGAHPTPKNSGAPSRPPTSLLPGLLPSSPSRKETKNPRPAPAPTGPTPRPRTKNPQVARVFDDSSRKVVLVRDKTMGFHWADDDGWIFSPALWGDVDEASVRKAFEGPTSDGRLAVTAVRRCCHREARAVKFLDSTKGRGAWAFGWYGAAAHDVQVAADGGDLAVNWPLLGAFRAHGRGIHLSVQDKPMPSVELSVANMNNQQTAHLLFCVLSPGFPEIIDAGSPQSQPSSPLFRSGTDASENPTWHVIWESSAGTQILPLYMVSFRPTQLCRKRPGSPHEEASIQKKVRPSV